MTLRENLSESKAWAHAVLDDVRAGLHRSEASVIAALRILGDM